MRERTGVLQIPQATRPGQPQSNQSARGGTSTNRVLTRRAFSVALAAGALAGCGKKEVPKPESPAFDLALQYAEKHLLPKQREDFIENAKSVDQFYSEAIVRSHYRGRIYDIPANFYTTTGRRIFKRYSAPDFGRYEIEKAGDGLGSWHFFWPDFKGFTRDNWFDQFDKRLITYVSFRLHPPEYPEQTTAEVLENLKRLGVIELQPSAELHGLKGHRQGRTNNYYWVGRRATGEMFSMRSIHPVVRDGSSPPLPNCIVKMYDRGTGESIFYFYSIDLFEHWYEIDHRTQAAIKSWRVV